MKQSPVGHIHEFGGKKQVTTETLIQGNKVKKRKICISKKISLVAVEYHRKQSVRGKCRCEKPS